MLRRLSLWRSAAIEISQRGMCFFFPLIKLDKRGASFEASLREAPQDEEG
jgi:hypothetical protein